MKLLISFCCFILLSLFLLDCSQKESSPVAPEEFNSLSKKKKPPVVQDTPEIANLWIESHETTKTIPSDEVVVHYEVINASNVDHMTIAFRYDPDGDGMYRTFFDPYVFYETIPGNGENEISGSFSWDGSVGPDFSSGDYLFNQLATDPDQYLLHFSVSGQNIWAYNGQPDADEMVTITAGPAPGSPFWITDVSAAQKTPTKKMKKYAAELIATVTCSEAGFRGTGQWIQVNPETGEKIPWELFDGCPNGLLNNEDGDNEASPNCQLFVGPGTYRFYVRNVYHPDRSYNPWEHISINPEWTWPDSEPYVEITVD